MNHSTPHTLKRNLLLAFSLFGFACGANANLITNGGFEASNSQTNTPTGWTNIGHSDGVITYGIFGTPVYEGLNYYDLGGYGDPNGPIGDGISQSFATIIGNTYNVFFGLSSENVDRSKTETLTVAAGNTFIDYILAVDGTGEFKKAFTTQNFSFTALNSLTTLSFIHTAGNGGANDPLIDNVIVDAKATDINTVPLPGAVWLLGSALVGFAGFGRRKSI